MRATGFGLDGLLHVADRRPLGAWHPHRSRELRLATGAPQVQHQPAGHRLCDVGAVVVLDERERQVDARGDTGRRPRLVRAADEDRLGIDCDRGEFARHLSGERPVRGRDATVEQAGLGGDERASAHADDATGVLGRDLYPADGVPVVPDGVDAATAGQDQRVDRFAWVGQRLGDEREAGAGGGGFAVLRDDTDGVTLVDASLTRQ